MLCGICGALQPPDWNFHKSCIVLLCVTLRESQRTNGVDRMRALRHIPVVVILDCCFSFLICCNKRRLEGLYEAHKFCRFNAASLASTVINNSPNPDEFSMVNGVGDSSTFTADASWDQPEGSQDLCYVGMSLLFPLPIVHYCGAFQISAEAHAWHKLKQTSWMVFL